MMKNLWRFITGGIAFGLLVTTYATSSPVEQVSNNLIANPSVEASSVDPKIPEGWYQDYYGNGARSFSYPVQGEDGSRGLQVQISRISRGDAKWAFNDVPVTGGSYYSYSDFYKSNIKSYYIIRFLNKNGVYRYFDVDTADPSTDWKQKTITFQVPTNATSITVYHLIKDVGFLTTDNFSLTPGIISTITPIPTTPPITSVTPTTVPTTTIAPTTTDSPSVTSVPSTTVTDQPTVTTIPTITSIPTNTTTVAPTSTTVPTITSTIKPTVTNTVAPSPTITTGPTITVSPTTTTVSPTNTTVPTTTVKPTVTNTIIPTPTGTVPTITSGPTITPTNTTVPTPTGSVGPTVTIVPSITITPTVTDTPTITNTPTTVPTTTTVPTITQTQTPTPPTTGNLITNPSLEASGNGSAPDGWSNGSWGTNTVSFTYPVAGFQGARAAKVDITSYSSGDAKWFFNDVTVKPNSSYAFSDSYQSNVTSQLVIRYLSTTGVYSYINLTSLVPSTNWTTTNQTFTVPSGTQSLTIFHLIASTGTLSVDNYSLTEIPPPPSFTKGMVSFDFDDGWESTLQNGIPILDAAGYKSTNYIITQYMENAPGYDTTAEVLQLKADGHDVESHSQTHPDLTTLSQAQMQAEICGSRQDLINIGITPVSLAFPYGTWNSSVLDVVKSCGYSASRTALIEDGGYNAQNQNPYLLKTQDIESATTIADIQAMIDNAAATKTWVILVMHSVAGDGTQYDTSPAKLQAIVDYVKKSNVDVVTVRQGLSRMGQ